jgi:hypothetical protein
MELKDSLGTTYTSPDGKQAGSGVSVTIYGGSNGPQAGTMIGGVAVPNK